MRPVGIDVEVGGLVGVTGKEAGRSAEIVDGETDGEIDEKEHRRFAESVGDNGDEVVQAGAEEKEAIRFDGKGGDKTPLVCIDEVVDAVPRRFVVEFVTGGIFSFCACCFFLTNIDLAPLLLLLW